jgi:hypothetical protein
MMGCRSSDSCRKLFFTLEILPLASQYILSVFRFVYDKKQESFSGQFLDMYITLTVGNF